MSVKNNYFKTLQYQNRFFTANPGGWEIHIKVDDFQVYRHGSKVFDKEGNPKIKKEIRVCIPSDCKRETKANIKIFLSREKRLAQSVQTVEEFQKLKQRIDERNWSYIEEHDLKDEALVNWAYNTRTDDEYDRLLRYN